MPAKFDFQKDTNQYSINSLTEALLQKKGFTVCFNNTPLPADLANNKCHALLADLQEKSSMFTTGLTLILKDCQGNVIFKSKQGKSREKDYEAAYSGALRDAFTSLDQVPYNYTGQNYEPGQTAAATVVPATPAVVPVTAQPVAVPTPAKPAETVAVQPAGTLYAQAIVNGYQLTDTTPKIVLTILKTSAADLFIADSGSNKGIVMKKGEDWYFEYYKEGKLNSEKLVIKF